MTPVATSTRGGSGLGVQLHLPSAHLSPASAAQPALAALRAAEDAQSAWTATAHALAGGGRVRVSRDGGRSYPRSGERALPATVPNQPAAVLIYDQDGQARCLPADFDVARGGAGQVEQDLARLQRLLERCGAHAITDRSPNGGRHLYVPWSQPVPFAELRAVMVALSGLLPSLDILPAVNLRAGCLRPPGSRHRSGGWQNLTTPLTEARRIARDGNGPQVWLALQDLLAPQLARPLTTPSSSSSRAERVTLPAAAAGGSGPHERLARTLQVPLAKGPRRLSPEALLVAEHAQYDTTRYSTPSQARQRVHAAAAGAGWTFDDLVERLQTGRWPGLAALYARYRPAARAERIAADWCSAVTWINSQQSVGSALVEPQAAIEGPLPNHHALAVNSPRKRADEEPTHNSHTREPSTHGGQGDTARLRPAAGEQQTAAEYRFIRSWWNAALRAERSRYGGRGGLVRRLLLRALANAAQKSGTRYVEFGCRSLSLATGVDHSTVAAALRLLRAEADPLLVLLQDRRGVRADLYELVVPREFSESLERRDWLPGKFEAIAPAFRALGLPVAFIYERLDGQGASSFELGELAMVSHRAAQAGLKVLAEHGLATRTAAGWVRGPNSLSRVAEALGLEERLEAVHARYRAERLTWRALLGAWASGVSSRARRPAEGGAQASAVDAGTGLSASSREVHEVGPEPPEVLETPLELLYRVLGAVPVAS